MKKILIWTAVVIAIVSGGFLAYRKVTKKQEKTVETAVVKFGTIEEIVSATGAIKSAKDLDLSFKFSGTINNMSAQIGANVKQGDRLASLDTSDLDSSSMESEAAVKVAQAQLDEVKSGASQQEIEVQKVSVSNAEENLAKAKENADRAIAASQAQVDSQKIAVNGKKQSLEDVKKSADNSLKSVYETGLDTADSKYITAFNAVDAVNAMFKDQDLMDILGNLNYQLRINAGIAKDDIISALNRLKPFIDKADSTKNNADVDKAIAELKIELNKMDDSLGVIYSALLSTEPMVNITKVELDVYKTSMSTQRSFIIAAITSATSTEQGISTIKISNTSSINAAQQALDSAEALLLQYQAALESSKTSQAAAIASSEGALKLAQEQLSLKETSAKPETIAVYQARLSQAKASFSSIQKKYLDREIIAPVGGVIANTFKEEGESANPGEKIVSMIAGSGFEIEIDIPESDITKVKVNDPCGITLDAFPSDEIFKGSVISIYPAEKIAEGVVYYTAKVILSDQNEEIKPGMTANVDISTAKKEDALVAPARFIKDKNGKSYAKVIFPDGSTQEREVEKGIRGEDGDVEIISGLKEGERITE